MAKRFEVYAIVNNKDSPLYDREILLWVGASRTQAEIAVKEFSDHKVQNWREWRIVETELDNARKSI
jgi:hypothetical protein